MASLIDSQRRDYRDFVLQFYKEEKEKEVGRLEVGLRDSKGEKESKDGKLTKVQLRSSNETDEKERSGSGSEPPRIAFDGSRRRTSSIAESTSSGGALSAAGGWLLGKFLGESSITENNPQSDSSYLQVNQSIPGSKGGKSPSKESRSPFMSKASSGTSLASLADEVRLEESYTVHLGSQKKSSHNLRLIRDDLIDFCSHDKTSGLAPEGYLQGSGGETEPASPSKGIVPDAIRAQTSMLLYSFNLSGMILLVPLKVYRSHGTLPDFISLCESSTDFHFPALEIQLEKVREDVMFNCTGKQLHAGDYFITRHSNLAGIHVVFHLIVDDSDTDGSSVQKSEKGVPSKLSPRSDVIIGLRNILYAVFSYDIHSLSLPLLMLPSNASVSLESGGDDSLISNEDKVDTSSGRKFNLKKGGGIEVKLKEKEYLKRCEMVLKCVKGFILENTSSWGYSYKERTIQFLVPVQPTSETLFQNVSSMLSGIYRMPTPLDLSQR